jgi:8-oxo-dGTP pyrophosphatase MutT (NUDIX family)
MSVRPPTLPEGGAVPARPAATVVLLRDGAAGRQAAGREVADCEVADCEVLLVRRNAQLAFHGGAWVFPGGGIDPADYAAAGDGNDTRGAACHAACREAWEEAGVQIAPSSLVVFSRWVTPEGLPKRFDAWFFAARAGADVVRVDGGEIHAHQWIRPADALQAHRAGTLDLPPPTWVTLHRLSGYATVAETLRAVSQGPIEEFVPRVCLVPEGACSLYAGDAAYENGQVDQPGPRHRLWMLESGWRYEKSSDD